MQSCMCKLLHFANQCVIEAFQPASHGVSSNLAKLLLEHFWGGDLPATDVQAIAHAASLNGCSHPEVLRLASFGSLGNNPGNVHNQLLQTYVKDGAFLRLGFIINASCWFTNSKQFSNAFSQCCPL